MEGSQAQFVLPEVLAQFRRRLDEPLMAELLALQAATAMEDGLVSPAHLVVDTFPSEQGSPRVTDAATLYKAQQKSSRSSRPSLLSALPRARRCRCKRSTSRGMCPIDPVCTKVTVKSEDATEIQPLSRNHQRGISQVHWCIVILPHKCPHAFPLSGLRRMQHDQLIRQIAP